MKLIEFPNDDFSDISKMLRGLADSIESGELEDINGLVWCAVTKCGDTTSGYCEYALDDICQANMILDLGKTCLQDVFLERHTE